MSTSLSYKDAEQKIKSMNYPVQVKHHAKERKLNITRLSMMIGKDKGFITQQLKRGTLSMPLMYALSCHLAVNLFEPFTELLPENIRPIKREKELQQQVQQLQQELEDVKKERDSPLAQFSRPVLNRYLSFNETYNCVNNLPYKYRRPTRLWRTSE